MSQGRRHVQTYIGVTDYGRLHREAAARRSTISKCTADCLREYFALRAELATAIETPGLPGDPHDGAIIHSLLARSEERIVATIDRRTTEILGELRCEKAMLERLVQLYLYHTPGMPHERPGAAGGAARQRDTKYLAPGDARLARTERGS